MQGMTVSRAAAESGWSARMLRYLEDQGLVVPLRKPSGYRLYGLSDLAWRWRRFRTKASRLF
jgi:DNA-binding transcriptional MerR regulator